jgi:hypothetical protein
MELIQQLQGGGMGGVLALEPGKLISVSQKSQAQSALVDVL